MLKTQTLQQAIDFVLGSSAAQKYVRELEAEPDKFVISSITATVVNYQKNIIRILINFNERGNPNNYKEDAMVDVQGTEFSNFKILNVVAYQSNP